MRCAMMTVCDSRVSLLPLLLFLSCFDWGFADDGQRPRTPQSPIMFLQGAETKDPGEAGGAKTAFAIMRLPDGSFAFYDRNAPAKGPLSLAEKGGPLHTLLPQIPPQIAKSQTILQTGVLNNTQVILTKNNEVLSLSVRNEALSREQALKVGLPRYLNTWFQKADPEMAHDAKMTWRGYNGSQMEYQRLTNGRLLVPHGSLQPHLQTKPPFGRHETIIQYSDDEGDTWQVSKTKLVAPCYSGFNGSNEGACEPTIEELNDGRVWMLMRTASGFLYESHSSDNGTTWTRARASRFNTSTGPANLMRHRNGWLALCWNNCEMPPRHEGEGVYGGRDALHMAVSDDDGRSWRGFREIYLDHRRNENPARSGDRGTAYPLGAYTADGRFVVLAGQGEGGRNPILIDPEWIVATTAKTDFSDELKQWATYTHHGPAKRWWRARAAGSRLVPHPSDPN
ncbi:MAG: exo-alpha-sialidase, partial [Planctomycetaceae bacterium]|nr:exo-alpha-sialidase [Planctomycetaceae bacterium]